MNESLKNAFEEDGAAPFGSSHGETEYGEYEPQRTYAEYQNESQQGSMGSRDNTSRYQSSYSNDRYDTYRREAPRITREYAPEHPVHVRRESFADTQDLRFGRYEDRQSDTAYSDRRTDRLERHADRLHGRYESQIQHAPTQRRLRIGHHERFRTDSETGNQISEKRFGIYTNRRILYEGERSGKQRLIYQAGHAPKEWLKRSLSEAENLEGNEAVQLAHKGETALKNRIIKPFVRTHVPIGFDYHQRKANKLRQREKLTRARADIVREGKRKKLSSNPISRAAQKRRIKKIMYAKHGIKKGVIAKLKNGAKGILRSINPIIRVKRYITLIVAAIAAFFAVIIAVIILLIILVLIAIVAIAITSLLSLFFNFGGDNSAQQEMAKITNHWSELFCDMRMDLINADSSDTFSGYTDLDEVRLGAGVTANAQTEYKRQIKMLGILAAMWPEDLTLTKADEEIEAIFNDIYVVNQNHFNEQYNCGEEGCEECPHDWWVLELSVTEGDFDGYLSSKLNTITDPDVQELALARYEQYQMSFGMGQICNNPLGEGYDWRNNISSTYGYRIMDNAKEKHDGLDIAIPEGTPLYAVATADVTETGTDDARGNYVILKFQDPGGGDDLKVTYMHCKSILVSTGQSVTSGQQIALSGNTGRSSGPHLHLEIKKGSNTLNPLLLIDFS
jgi:murein DD-endopeptidase MepM/ murein hydrolase activator NlpD